MIMVGFPSVNDYYVDKTDGSTMSKGEVWKDAGEASMVERIRPKLEEEYLV